LLHSKMIGFIDTRPLIVTLKGITKDNFVSFLKMEVWLSYS